MVRSILFVCYFATFPLFSQHKGAWFEHISFNQLQDVAQVGDIIYGATSQAIMTYTKATGEVDRITKQSGLSDVNIIALAVHKPSKQLVIGYENGNIDLYRNGRITNISDISRSTLYLGNRRLNNLQVVGDRLYVSMAFGIVVIDLTENLVRETYIIGPAGSQIEVYQIDIDHHNGFIYAGTEAGLYRANLNSSLVFFQNWTRVEEFGQIKIPFVAVYNSTPFVCKYADGPNDTIYYLKDSVWTHFEDFEIQSYSDLRSSEGLLIGAHDFGFRTFNKNYGMIHNLNRGNLHRDPFSPVKVIRDADQNNIWIASAAEGLYQINSSSYLFSYLPEGPPRNIAYSLFHNGKSLYVGTAALSSTYTEQYNRSGIFTYSDFNWGVIPSDVLNNVADIVCVITHPDNPNHFFIGSWGDGLLEYKDGQLINVYNAANHATHGLTRVNNTGGSIRVGWMDWDSKGNLWIVTSQNNTPLSVLRADGSWESFSVGSSIGSSTIVQRMMITSEDQIWIQARNSGIVVCKEDESGNLNVVHLNQNEGSGELPSNAVNDFDEDRNGAMWIGTGAGVGVIFNPRNIFESGQNYDAVRITFEEDGVVQALLSQENVTCVVVDGANKKWFGTSFRGAFYTSSDGREEIYAFSQSTSPLPSSTILDIAVDSETGEVFFATPGGVTSYQGAATQGKDEFEGPFAYPNPVRPEHTGPIFIRNLVTDSQVKITDVYGNLVFETRAEGGQAVWDGRGFSGEPVASGVYQAFMNDQEGFRTSVVKILIVR